MTYITTIKCDDCGILKKDTNGWWVAHAITSKDVRISKFIPGTTLAKNDYTLCGKACLFHFIDVWLEQL